MMNCLIEYNNMDPYEKMCLIEEFLGGQIPDHYDHTDYRGVDVVCKKWFVMSSDMK